MHTHLSSVLPNVGAEQLEGAERRCGHEGRGEEGRAVPSKVDGGYLSTQGWELRGSWLARRGRAVSVCAWRGTGDMRLEPKSSGGELHSGQRKQRRGEHAGREKMEKR